MSKILGANGKPIISPKLIKVGEFEFLKDVLDSQPMLLLMTLIALDPTPKQKLLLDQLDFSFTDSSGNFIFPQAEVKEEA